MWKRVSGIFSPVKRVSKPPTVNQHGRGLFKQQKRKRQAWPMSQTSKEQKHPTRNHLYSCWNMDFTVLLQVQSTNMTCQYMSSSLKPKIFRYSSLKSGKRVSSLLITGKHQGIQKRLVAVSEPHRTRSKKPGVGGSHAARYGCILGCFPLPATVTTSKIPINLYIPMLMEGENPKVYLIFAGHDLRPEKTPVAS